MSKFPQLNIKSEPVGAVTYYQIEGVRATTVPQAAQVGYRIGAARAFKMIREAVEKGDLKTIVELASQANVEDFYL